MCKGYDVVRFKILDKVISSVQHDNVPLDVEIGAASETNDIINAEIICV